MCLAIPARIVQLTQDEPSRALVDVMGVRRQIDTGLLDEPLQSGDWVLVHVGFAMSRISEADALDQLRILELLGEDTAAKQEATAYGAAPGPDGDSRTPT